MKHPLAKITPWLVRSGMIAALVLGGIAGSAQASGWGPWNSGRHWTWQSDKHNDFFSWGTGESNNPWDKWGPWNKRKQYPWESDRWDKLPWSGNRPWDRGGFDMPWSKKKARRERRKDYLEYLQDSRKQRLKRKLRYARPPYPPPPPYGYGYGYGYPPRGYLPPPAQGAPAPKRSAAATQAAQAQPPAAPPATGQPSSGTPGETK